MKTFFVLN